jgi:hypothetical protein
MAAANHALPRSAVTGGAAPHGYAAAASRRHVDIDVLLGAARRNGATHVQFGGYTIFFNRQAAEGNINPHQPKDNAKARRSARRARHWHEARKAAAAAAMADTCGASTAAPASAGRSTDWSQCRDGAMAKGGAEERTVGAALGEAETKAAARRVRWSPILVELREFSPYQPQEQQIQVAASGAATASEAVPDAAEAEMEQQQHEEEEEEEEEQAAAAAAAAAGVDERHAVRAETGKRQAVGGVPPCETDTTPARARTRGLDVRADAPRIRKPGKNKAPAPAVSTAAVLAWAAAHRAAHGL